jgi:hypothetical protein
MDFILQNLQKSISGQSVKKTNYYLAIGGVIGLLLAFATNFIQKKLAKIEQLRNVHGINSTTITQNDCFRLGDLKRRIVTLRNDLRSPNLGQ